MTRRLLSSIRTLTFYDDELTASRSGKPIPQLTCHGSACKLYKPEMVRCKNAGGEGMDIEWTCEANLPDALSFGRVDVECEGWSSSGDPYVYKESCGLEYHLVHIPGILRDEQYDPFASRSRNSLGDYSLVVLTIGLLAILIYLLFHPANPAAAPSPPPPAGRARGFGGGRNGDEPYLPSDKPGASTSILTDIPGAVFLAGAALGGMGTYLATRGMGDPEGERRQYEWERRRAGEAPVRDRGTFGGGANDGKRFDDDLGEGLSNGFGSARRSTGVEGSNVR